jgi:lipopolysaccharide export system permease protein
MNIMDRYVAWTFLKIFVICLVSLSGLFIVVDTFSNLEEFVELGENTNGFAGVLCAYYAPRVFALGDRSLAILSLTAAIGTMVWMQRYNELAAIEAGGIPKSRIVRPILYCALALIGLNIANRELFIPRYRELLARNAQSWDGTKPRAVNPQQDQVTGVWIVSGKVIPASGQIQEVEFRLPDSYRDFGTSIQAEAARLVDATERHPAGFLLSQVTAPLPDRERGSLEVEGQPMVLTPRDHPWMQPDELLIVSRISLMDIAYGPELRRFGSLAQQISAVNNPSVWTASRQRVDIHARLVRPALDFAILLMGLPVIVSRRDRNVFMALGTCLVLVLAMQVVVLTCHNLGATRIISSAALAAWLPIMALLPGGVAMQVRLNR